MARPKKSNEERSARQRILDAFWGLIEQAPLEKITVKQIVNAAHINRNTFYYHFGSIADLANDALIENMPIKAMGHVISEALTSSASGFDLSRFEPPADIEIRYHRVRLLLSKKDTEARAILERTLKKIWSEIIEIETDAIDVRHQAKIDFICGGLAALITSKNTPTFTDYIAEIDNDIGEIIVALLKHSIDAPETEMTR